MTQTMTGEIKAKILEKAEEIYNEEGYEYPKTMQFAFERGAAFCLSPEILSMQPEVKALVDAAKALGLQCVNTGCYGQLGIRPGECTCSTCSMKKALTQFNEFLKGGKK